MLIGTPIWAGTMSSPVRTYIMQNKERFKNVGFFCTGDSGSDADKTLEAMKGLCARETVASVAIREAKSEEYLQKIDEFVNKIKRTCGPD